MLTAVCQSGQRPEEGFGDYALSTRPNGRLAWGPALICTEREGDVMRKQGFLLWLAVGACLVAALPAFSAAPAAALSFAPPVHYGLGGRPADLASADLNGDGRPDIAASAGDGIAVLLGSGRGRFAPATRVPLEHRPGAIAVADVDRDGTQDVVTANRDGTVSVLLGDGTGAFVLKGTFPTGTSPSDVVVGDLNGDGVPDLATADGDGLSILAGDGAGALLSPLHLPVGEGCRRVVAGDFDLDGSLDLAFTRILLGGVLRLRGAARGRRGRLLASRHVQHVPRARRSGGVRPEPGPQA